MHTSEEAKKIQLVFKDTGMMLSKTDLKQFLGYIKHPENSAPPCATCSKSSYCKPLLVNSPAKEVCFVMNIEDLKSVKDLVEGALFNLDLNALLRTF